MSAEALDVRSRLVNRYKETVKESAAVVISALSVLISCGALMFAGIAMYVSADVKAEIMQLEDEIRLAEVYVQELEVKVRGLE